MEPKNPGENDYEAEVTEIRSPEPRMDGALALATVPSESEEEAPMTREQRRSRRKRDAGSSRFPRYIC
jgi:hypothetical protein